MAGWEILYNLEEGLNEKIIYINKYGLFRCHIWLPDGKPRVGDKWTIYTWFKVGSDSRDGLDFVHKKDHSLSFNPIPIVWVTHMFFFWGGCFSYKLEMGLLSHCFDIIQYHVLVVSYQSRFEFHKIPISWWFITLGPPPQVGSDEGADLRSSVTLVNGWSVQGKNAGNIRKPWLEAPRCLGASCGFELMKL